MKQSRTVVAMEKDVVLSTLQDCLTRIASHWPGYQLRASQHAMMLAVIDTFFEATLPDKQPPQPGQSIIAIEGPTGTGKSLGYLLPAILMAKVQQKKLVVSSATVALQEQLAHQDLPFLVKYAGLSLSYVIAKGRGRYVCPQRLKQQIENAENGFVQEDLFTPLAPIESHHLALFKKWLHALTEKTWSGDRDTLAEPAPDGVWSNITNDRHGCLKKKCPDFNGCPFFNAREQLKQADVIIANHDLLLADIAMGGGALLTKPEKTFYCVDEAHHLTGKAIQAFAASHALYGAFGWLEKIMPTLNRSSAALKDINFLPSLAESIKALVEYLHDVARLLETLPELHLEPTASSLTFRFSQGIVPDFLSPFCDNLATITQSILTMLILCQEHLKMTSNSQKTPTEEKLRERSLADLGFLMGRMENLASVWRFFSEKTPLDMPPIAKWITVTRNFRNRLEPHDYHLSASPVTAAPLLVTHFWERAAGVVLTSATLRSLGTFDRLFEETGLDAYPAVRKLALDSPFNFKRQGRLHVPPMQSIPPDAEAHTQEIIALLPSLLCTDEGEGSLVLFSSQKQMRDVARGLPSALQALLLVQGEQAKEKLLKAHFAKIKSLQPSILFGLASFAEGLDLPGHACRHVIIAKIPFSVPDDPVAQTLADWLKKRGRDPFREIILPATGLRLTQAVGRLIRTETDTGTITILDNRLKTKNYGAILLKHLPPFERSGIIA